MIRILCKVYIKIFFTEAFLNNINWGCCFKLIILNFKIFKKIKKPIIEFLFH